MREHSRMVAPILIDKKTAAKLLGISVRMVERLVRRKRLEPVGLCGKVQFRIEDVQELALKPSQRKTLRRECSASVQ